MTTKKIVLEHVLTPSGYEYNEKSIVKKDVGTLCMMKNIQRKT